VIIPVFRSNVDNVPIWFAHENPIYVKEIETELGFDRTVKNILLICYEAQ